MIQDLRVSKCLLSSPLESHLWPLTWMSQDNDCAHRYHIGWCLLINLV